MCDFITHINSLRLLKKLGTSICYTHTNGFESTKASILVFYNAGRKVDHGQISGLCGLLTDDAEEGAVLHTLSWISHKSKRPVKSVGATEILADGDAIDEWKMLQLALSTLLPVEFDFMLVVDSRDLFILLSTCSHATDSSIRADLNVTRYECESRNVPSIMWVPCKVNSANLCTKPNSPQTDSVQLLLASFKLALGFSDSDVRSCNRFTG